MFYVPSKSKAYKRIQWLHNAGPKDEDLPEEARICGVSNGSVSYTHLTLPTKRIV